MEKIKKNFLNLFWPLQISLAIEVALVITLLGFVVGIYKINDSAISFALLMIICSFVFGALVGLVLNLVIEIEDGHLSVKDFNNIAIGAGTVALGILILCLHGPYLVIIFIAPSIWLGGDFVENICQITGRKEPDLSNWPGIH